MVRAIPDDQKRHYPGMLGSDRFEENKGEPLWREFPSQELRERRNVGFLHGNHAIEKKGIFQR
jgi:hypothetical protein